MLKEMGYSLVPKHHSQSYHLLGLQNPEKISFQVLQKVGSMSQGDLAVLLHQQLVTATIQSSGHSVYHSFHLLPAGGTFFLPPEINIFHWEISNVSVLCTVKSQIYLKPHLASPERIPCYICKRHVPTWHALPSDNIWAKASFFMHFSWVFLWHYKNARKDLRGIVALINSFVPVKLQE